MRNSILDEEWRHDGDRGALHVDSLHAWGFGCFHEMAATRQRA